MTALSKLYEYGQEFQLKIIALLLVDKKFLLNTANGIKLEYFENESHQWIVNTVLTYYHEYRTNPTKDYIDSSYKKLGDVALSESIKVNLAKCNRMVHESIADKAWVEKEFRQFCFKQSLKNAIMDSVDLIAAGKDDEVQSLMAGVFKLKNDEHIGKDAKKDIESVLRDEDRHVIPFKFDSITKLTDGGYGAGDLVIIVGSPGGGKTSMLIANTAYALTLGKNILHYTLELTEDYTIRKYYAALIDCEVKELKQNRAELEEELSTLPGRLMVKYYPPKKVTFQMIENHIQQLKEQEDFVPDAIVIDYLDYVRSYANRAEKKDEIDDVYIQAKALAGELGIPILSPSQANRTAAKSAIIQGDALAGSYDKLMIADICFSLARTTVDKNAGIGRLHVVKNRYGADGGTYLCEIDLGRNYIAVSDEPMTEDEIENSDKIPKKQMQKIEDKVRKLFDD